jgi:hypothetical protein
LQTSSFKQKKAVNEEWGFSIKSRGTNSSDSVNAPMIDFVHFLQDYVYCRKIPDPVEENHGLPPRILIKIDIEGSEYKVFQRLIEAAKTEGFDLSKIYSIVGEFHPKFAPLTVGNKTISERNKLVQLQRNLVKELADLGGPQFLDFDDEEYYKDGMEYPQPPTHQYEK